MLLRAIWAQNSDDIVPRLVAHLILTLYSRIFAEYARRRLKGKFSEEIHAGLSAMVTAGLDLLAHGIDASENKGSQL